MRRHEYVEWEIESAASRRTCSITAGCISLITNRGEQDVAEEDDDVDDDDDDDDDGALLPVVVVVVAVLFFFPLATYETGGEGCRDVDAAPLAVVGVVVANVAVVAVFDV